MQFQIEDIVTVTLPNFSAFIGIVIDTDDGYLYVKRTTTDSPCWVSADFCHKD